MHCTHGENKYDKGAIITRPVLKQSSQRKNSRFNLLGQRLKLQGQVESFDQYVVLLRNTVTQMVYKHAISTIVPARAVPLAGEQTEAE